MQQGLRIALALCLTFGALPLAADEPAWTPIGPDGGFMDTLATSPALPGWIFGGLAEPGPVLVRSTDRGRSWTVDDRLSRTGDLAIAANGRTIFAATETGLQRSTDRGATWAPSGPDAQGFRFAYTLVQTHPRRAGLVFAVRLEEEQRLHRSADGGATWTTDPAWPENIRALAFGPGDLVFAATDGRAFWRSTDAGRTWRPLGQGLPAGARMVALAIDPRHPGVLYTGLLATRRTLFKSTDGGATWRPSQRGLAVDGRPVQAVRDLVLDAADPSIVYAIVGISLFRSTDQGRNWTRLPPPPSEAVNDLEATGYGLLAATPSGIQLSTDRGLTWRPRNPSVAAARVLDLAFGSTGENPPHLYALAGGRLWRTTDRGASWRFFGPADDLDDPFFSGAPEMAAAPSDPRTVYISQDRTLARSTNGGQNWQYFQNPCRILSGLVVDPREASHLYATAHYLSGGCGVLPAALVESTDGGATWHQLLALEWRVLAVDPFDLGLYIQSASTGDLWHFPFSPSDTPRFAGLSAVAFVPSPLTPGLLWAARAGEVGRSQNGGITWHFSAAGLPAGATVTALAPDPVDPSTVYAGTAAQGVFKSTDAGATWSPVGTWPAGVSLHGGLLVDPTDPSILYAGTDVAGVLKLDHGDH